MKIGILLPNWIGDVVMATPTLRALRNHFGSEVMLTGVIRPYAFDVLAGSPWLDECVPYDPRSKDRSLRAMGVAHRLRARNIDTLLLLTNSLRAAMIAWLSGAKHRVGYGRNTRAPLLTSCLRPPRSGLRLRPVSAVDYYLELAYSLGCPPSSHHVELGTTDDEERLADRVWNKLGLGDAERVVTFNCGGAYGSAKRWYPESFAELAEQLVRDARTSVLVLCGPSERDVAAEITRLADHPRVVSLAEEEPSLGLSKASVRRSQLLVSTDSGPRHFAAGYKVPCVALFGATDPRWSRNYHPQEIVVREELPCAPCAKRICPKGHHECMRALSPERVFRAVEEILGRNLQSRVA